MSEERQNLMAYSTAELARLRRQILLRLEMWTARNWSEAKFDGQVRGPFGANAWRDALRTIRGLKQGTPSRFAQGE